MAKNNQTDNNGKRKMKKGLMITLLVVCGLIWAVIIAGVIYFESLLGLINRADDEVLETMSDAQYQAMLDAMQETIPEDYTGETMDAEDVQWAEEAEDLEESEFEGDEIIWQDGMTVTYEDLSDEDEPQNMVFAFIFNDIFGEDSMSDLIEFEL